MSTEDTGTKRIFKPPKDYRHKKPKTIARLEQWARDHKVILQKIPEEPGKKTPDYKAIFPDSDKTSMIIEVKEILASFQVDPKTPGGPQNRCDGGT